MSCTSKLVSTAVDKQFKVIWRKTYAWYGHLSSLLKVGGYETRVINTNKLINILYFTKISLLNTVWCKLLAHIINFYDILLSLFLIH